MDSTPFILSLAVIVSAIVTIVVRYTRPPLPRLFYIFKPLTTCLILVLAVASQSQGWSTYGAAIVLGLSFSLVGDVLLMLPSDRFVAGLGSFLLALLSYCVAFGAGIRWVGDPWLALPLVGIGAFMLWYLWPGLPPTLRLPVSAYVWVFVATASLAALRAAADPSAGTLAAAVGALLFMASDSMLAIERFRHPFRLGQAIVLGTYFAGQLLIALSVGL